MTAHAFDFLHETAPRLPGICIVYGDEPFLKQLVLGRIRQTIVGADDDEVPFADLEGATCAWRDVADELTTVSLFGGSTRLVVVSEADDFVSKHRPQLEKLAEKPPSAGTLVLEVKSWPGNTRLAKQVAKTGLAVDCRPPQRLVRNRSQLDQARLCQWFASWAQRQHQLKLSSSLAAQIVDIIGPHMGLIDQELAKLALYADETGSVSAQTIVEVVGGWRTKTTWELLDAATTGNAAEALKQLDRLIQSGENPQALFGAFSWSLRRFAAATRVVERAERNGQRPDLQAALLEAGFRKFPREALQTAEASLRQLGRQRAGQLYRLLLDSDLRMKGSHSTPRRARYVLEMLLIRLAHQFACKSG